MNLLSTVKKAGIVLAATAGMGLASTSYAAVTAYSQDFEGLDQENAFALGIVGGDGYQVFNSSFLGDSVLYSYGPFSAPNGGPGFSAIANGEGGEAQGSQYLNVYSDYGNIDHEVNIVNHVTSVFQEQTIEAGDAGTYTFSFDAKAPFEGGIDTSRVSARAFIKTLDPNAGFFVSNDISADTTNVSNVEWASFAISITIDDSLVGSLLQFGFETTGGGYADSGVYYDNITFGEPSEVPVPAAAWMFGSALLGLAGAARKRKA